MTAGAYIASPSDRVSEQVREYEASGGTRANTLLDTGLPIIIVTTIGSARTGALRKTPLMRVEADGTYTLIASKGGAPQHPQWYHNVLAHPGEVHVQDGPAPFEVTVREAIGDERTRWWGRAVAAYPLYAEYQDTLALTDRLEFVVAAVRCVATRRGGHAHQPEPDRR